MEIKKIIYLFPENVFFIKIQVSFFIRKETHSNNRERLRLIRDDLRLIVEDCNRLLGKPKFMYEFHIVHSFMTSTKRYEKDSK